MEVTVIDERVEDGDWWQASRYTGYLASAVRAGEVYMVDVASMVQNVLKKLGNEQIERLNILDHGSTYGIQIGSDWVTAENVGSYEPTLSKLRSRFSPQGFLHLQHCMAGNNRSLMMAFSRIFGVRVYAGTGYQNPIYRINTGNYVVCVEHGCVDAARPGPR